MRRLADIERISDRCAMAPLSAWRIALGGFFPRRSGAAGALEVLSETTLLLRLEPAEPQADDSDEDSLMLGLFLDFLTRQALTAEQGPTVYTEAMAAEDDELLAGVELEQGA